MMTHYGIMSGSGHNNRINDRQFSDMDETSQLQVAGMICFEVHRIFLKV
jgi:hypothetical protein